MEPVGFALSVAQKLLPVLVSYELKQLFSMWGYKSELHYLEKTVETIKAVLSTAYSKQSLTPEQWNFIDNLKEALYEADDLIDEFFTMARQQQSHSPGKLQGLFSRLTKFKSSYKMSKEVKNIRKRLNKIGQDANQFCFNIDDQPIRHRREETCSYVNVSDIVGRDDDQNKIVDILVDPNSEQEEDVSVLAIVGIGGLGKTALAQVIFNDARVKKYFPRRLWVCVSDQDQNKFDVKLILSNVRRLMGEMPADNPSLEELVQEFREKLGENKYLLVLDDVWTENNGDWLKLKSYMMGLSQRGNKIVVTTRSEGTAIAVGSTYTYKLKGLSDEYSWCLFEMMVGSERANSHDLVEIGKEMVKKCANVPLAIKVIGSLLYGRDENTWRSFQKSRLIEIRKYENGIMPILEFSYHHLSMSLKRCFTYCAIFLKDRIINKEMLLQLWMAQDYVEPLDEGQSVEDAAEEYFQILVRRCFFQDIKEYTKGMVGFKIHDLIHDMAQKVAGKEISIENLTTSGLDKKIRHLSDMSPHFRTKCFMVKTKIRTYSYDYCNDFDEEAQFPVSTLLINCQSLRTLDLCRIAFRILPHTIGQLLHLRYLNLSFNRELERLPKSFTKLINLQYLNLQGCPKLKELPKDLSKLINLKTFYVPDVLDYMPLGMPKMTCLTRLNMFVVGEKKSYPQLEDLRYLKNLKGCLNIRLHQGYKHVCENGEYIRYIKHLSSIGIAWVPNKENEQVGLGNDEALLEDLKPNTNIKEITIDGYPGVRMPMWATKDILATSFPYLVEVSLQNCDGLQELPCLGRLQHLETLELKCLKNVEYMENSSDDRAIASNSLALESSMSFFPSLETLHLNEMPKLKGWWKGMCNSASETVNRDSNMSIAPTYSLLSFPRLSKLTINSCPNLTSIPLCPAVKDLNLVKLYETFRLVIKEDEKRVATGSDNDSVNSKREYCYEIRHISTDNMIYLSALPMAAFQCLVEFKLAEGHNMESMSVFEKVFRGSSCSLRTLGFFSKRKAFLAGVEYLTALEELWFHDVPELKFDETNGTSSKTDMPWRNLGQSLRRLGLCHLEKVVNLPKGMRYLTSLQTLYMCNLPVREIPDWIECLSSLQCLRIFRCKHLKLLPRALLNLTSLKRIELLDCHDELRRRCQNLDREYLPHLTIYYLD